MNRWVGWLVGRCVDKLVGWIDGWCGGMWMDG